ncbi:sensor histidine kinase [Magnetospirillum sulfuroxidans]|nr:sensor histidine kinase [Magnetospirillum sulfuroxidans]
MWRRLVRPRALLLVLFVLCLAVGGGATAALIRADYSDTRTAAEALTRHQARLLEQYFGRTLDAADQVVRRVIDQSMMQANRPLEISADQLDALRRTIAEAPHLDNLYLVDAKGRVVLDIQEGTKTGNSLATEEWVRAVLAGGGDALYLGAAARESTSGHVVFPVARAFRDRAGRVLGAVAAIVDVATFAALTDDGDLGPQPDLAVYRQDGVRLAAYPQMEGEGGQNQATRRAFAAPLTQAATGTFVVPGREGEGGRIVSYRSMPARNLVVCASLDVDEAMIPWRHRSVATLLTAALVLGLLITLVEVLAREIRRDRAASAALQAANRDLSRSNADLEQFAYVASHDLKEPLRNIASYVQLLQRRYHGRLDEDADTFIGYTVDGVRRMQVIINELLVYSRIGTGPLTRGTVQTGVLVSTALANLKSVIAEAGAAIEIKGPLPMVVGDAGQLGSVFQNLISNGLKYRRDEIRPELTIAAQDRGTQWQFSITDNGIGIDGQYHKQIFELFKRLHARDRYAGTGIGLAVCQRVIERHGGEIWVDSTPGQGACFCFTLPKG